MKLSSKLISLKASQSNIRLRREYDTKLVIYTQQSPGSNKWWRFFTWYCTSEESSQDSPKSTASSSRTDPASPSSRHQEIKRDKSHGDYGSRRRDNGCQVQQPSNNREHLSAHNLITRRVRTAMTVVARKLCQRGKKSHAKHNHASDGGWRMVLLPLGTERVLTGGHSGRPQGKARSVWTRVDTTNRQMEGRGVTCRSGSHRSKECTIGVDPGEPVKVKGVAGHINETMKKDRKQKKNETSRSAESPSTSTHHRPHLPQVLRKFCMLEQSLLYDFLNSL